MSAIDRASAWIIVATWALFVFVIGVQVGIHHGRALEREELKRKEPLRMNNLGFNLRRGQKVTLSPEYMEGTEYERTFVCVGGSGMLNSHPGRSINGRFTATGKPSIIDGGQIEKLIKEVA